jgi:predicted Holliday junction resolvase-like endonuclease
LERDAILQQEKVKETKEMEVQKKREEQRQRIIEEAKRLLLQKHATQLEGFLPNFQKKG